MKKFSSLYECYGFIGVFYLFICIIYTKLSFRQARLIRLPFDIRNRSYIKIGKNLTTGRNCRLETYNKNKVGLILGDNCELNDNVHIACAESIVIMDNVLIASRVFITDLNHGCYSNSSPSLPESIVSKRPLDSSKVVIGDNCWLGEGVVITKGVQLGKNCIVAANSVVTKSFPKNSIVGGVPAKVIKFYDEDSQEWKTAN
ncbi:acetyltransferase [Vibrio sp. OCN044]|uniref:Acetyltransferase n=1 Tax=Vibrio tetraodonis subsp. pristinus TaxID=2695891 RepID=A0A6L8LX62_9VIBR|nr:acetyltransferase [Vibrio tetraodonis subsp. pristinus]